MLRSQGRRSDKEKNVQNGLSYISCEIVEINSTSYEVVELNSTFCEEVELNSTLCEVVEPISTSFEIVDYSTEAVLHTIGRLKAVRGDIKKIFSDPGINNYMECFYPKVYIHLTQSQIKSYEQ